MAAVTEKIDAFRTTVIEAAIKTAHASADSAARLVALNFQAGKSHVAAATAALDHLTSSAKQVSSLSGAKRASARKRK
jgi:hypothetical protein